MAAEAVFQLVMGLSAVTAVTSGNVFANAGRVALMALHTGNIRFMGTALGFNIRRGLGMALDAVVIAELSRQA